MEGFSGNRFFQEAGYEYSDWFAPIAKFDTLLIVLIKMLLHKNSTYINLKTAFLYGCLDKGIYIQQPEGSDD